MSDQVQIKQILKTTNSWSGTPLPGFKEKLGFSYAASFKRCQTTFGAGYQFQSF